MNKKELLEMLDCLQQDYDNIDLECIDLMKENQKLKKVISILKERGGICLYINRNNDNKLTLDFDDCISCVLEPKEYVLLKEVLENE